MLGGGALDKGQWVGDTTLLGHQEQRVDIPCGNSPSFLINFEREQSCFVRETCLHDGVSQIASVCLSVSPSVTCPPAPVFAYY